MINNYLTEDTKAIILLCGVLGKDCTEKPLSLTEYSSLVRWLIKEKMRPGDLLQLNSIDEASIGSRIDKKRLESLLGRGVQLGFAVEEWQRNGIWIISRSDGDYPARLKKHLRDKAPPLLFGVGNRLLLDGGGLGIVGSRNVDQTGEAFTRQVAKLCAYNNMPVISGGARGVDQISMNAVIEAGGVAIGILAENLLKKSLERSARQAIADGRLLLLSPYHPNAHFTVGTAMGRNKLIYAMSTYALIVSAEYRKGGTWAGAEEELKRENSLPVFVRIANNVPQGNRKLLELGAISWPDSIDCIGFIEQLQTIIVNARNNQSNIDAELFDLQMDQEMNIPDYVSQVVEIDEKAPVAEQVNIDRKKTDSSDEPKSIYQAVLPFILKRLDYPLKIEELADALDVNKIQLNVWLKKALEENQIIELNNPLRYYRSQESASSKSVSTTTSPTSTGCGE